MICQTLASQIASVVESGNLGQLLWCNPLKHDTDDLISEKFSLHRIHVMVLEYSCLVLVAIFSARRPLANLPMPPVVLKVSGVKDASSTSLILCSYRPHLIRS